MANNYDAIVIGGGHNGLVSAAYLARAGPPNRGAGSRDKTGGAADTEHAVARAPGLQGHHALVRDEPDAAHHHPRPAPRAVRLQGLSDGPVLPGLCRTAVDEAVRGRRRQNHDEIAKFSKNDAEAMPMGRLARTASPTCSGPLLTSVPPKLGSREAGRPARPAAAGVADARPGRARRRRRRAPVHDEHHATCWTTGSSRRRSRRASPINGVIGTWAGPGRAGHGLRDGCTTRSATSATAHLGSWGFPEGGMGGGLGRHPPVGRVVRCGDPHRAPGRQVLVARRPGAGVALENGEELTAPMVVTTMHPKITFLDSSTRTSCPTTSCATSSAGRRAAAW